MSDNIAIKVDHVSKTFRLPHEKQTSLKGALISRFRGGKHTFEKQEVLQDISFEIKKGEFFGIVGRNGSGKSTLLKLLAEIYVPTQGSIKINGKLTPFIELGVGFNPELTGRENVFLNGALLGFDRQEMEDMYEDIVAFAEIERFMDQKLKNYSSGMQVRLAFSIAIRAKSDILLIDEVLAVGDAAFQTKCFDYFYKLKKEGATVVFVSHDRTSLERFCDRGILINNGKMITQGNIQKIFAKYSEIVLNELEDSPKATRKDRSTKKLVVSTQHAVINNVVTKNSKGQVSKKFVFGEEITLQFETKIYANINKPILGVTIWQKNLEKPVYATNSLLEGVVTDSYQKQDNIVFTATLPRTLNDGEYYIEPAIANESGTVFFDQRVKAATFLISGSNNPYSIVSISGKVKVEKN